MGNFHFTIMRFGHKSTEATYQRVMTFIFHDMLHNCLKYYVTDIVVKFKEVYNQCELSEGSLSKTRVI